MTDKTAPPRDEAVRELLRELHAVVMGECPSLLNEDSGGNADLALRIEDALASAPAPVSGGVDAAFTVASNLLRDGCTYVPRIPTCGPIAPMNEQPDAKRYGSEFPGEPATVGDLFKPTLAKPASSPAGRVE